MTPKQIEQLPRFYWRHIVGDYIYGKVSGEVYHICPAVGRDLMDTSSLLSTSRGFGNENMWLASKEGFKCFKCKTEPTSKELVILFLVSL
jgi:hypothetical protein